MSNVPEWGDYVNTYLNFEYAFFAWLDSTAILQMLTERERQVVRLYTLGQKKYAVAMELGLSEHTVVKHLERIFLKLGIHDRATLTHWAIRNGVVELMTFQEPA